MSSEARHRYSARVNSAAAARGRIASHRARTEAETLSLRWGVGACASCGRTLLLGEPVARVRRDDRLVTVCPECLEPAPAIPTWIAAPRRLDPVAVPLVEPVADVESAA